MTETAQVEAYDEGAAWTALRMLVDALRRAEQEINMVAGADVISVKKYAEVRNQLVKYIQLTDSFVMPELLTIEDIKK